MTCPRCKCGINLHVDQTGCVEAMAERMVEALVEQYQAGLRRALAIIERHANGQPGDPSNRIRHAESMRVADLIRKEIT